MKTHKLTLLLFIIIAGACKKDQPPARETEGIEKNNPINNPAFSLSQARSWYQAQPESLNDIEWGKARYQAGENPSWRIKVNGNPKQGLITGWQELDIQKHPSHTLKAIILEYLPEGIQLQQIRKLNPKTFSGRVFIRDLKNQLIGGYLYAEGKPVGNIDPDPHLAKENLLPLSTNPGLKSGGKGKLSLAQITESCVWIPGNYINSSGEVVIHSERICTYSITSVPLVEPFDALPTYSGGGGGGETNTPAKEYTTIPEVSNLPGEEATKVDPKKMTKCFSSIPDAGSTVKIKLYVQEPFPGTAFNIGPNSVGHVTLGITKSNGSQSITQVMGFYPKGKSLVNSPPVIRNNGNMEINVTATFTISTEQLSDLLKFYNEPPGYHLLFYNCTNFAFDALKAGGMSVPDPTVPVSLGGPMGSVNCMTPAGMGQVLRSLKQSNPKSDISTTDGFTPSSQGECP